MQSLYEIFGLISQNMSSFLVGMTDLCGEPYGIGGISLYSFFGIAMLAVSALIYALQYHIIDKVQFSTRKSWWMFAGLTFLVNVIVVFAVLWPLLGDGASKFDCDEEFFAMLHTVPEVGVVALVNGILGFLVFTLLSWPPLTRRLSKNCFNTKPI